MRVDDVVWAYSGARPLHDDGTLTLNAGTLNAGPEQPPLLSVFGGKITTYWVLAELAVNQLKGHFVAAEQPNWTGRVPLLDARRVGADRRRRAVASEQARLALLGRANSRARRLHAAQRGRTIVAE